MEVVFNWIHEIYKHAGAVGAWSLDLIRFAREQDIDCARGKKKKTGPLFGKTLMERPISCM